MGVMRRLEWLARKRMQGTLTGKHTSPDKGFSVEFAEHREYTPGDDPRNLDWRVMAKSDRNVIKQYIEETNLRVTVAVDISGSMAFRGEEAALVDGEAMSKFAYARYLVGDLRLPGALLPPGGEPAQPRAPHCGNPAPVRARGGDQGGGCPA